MPKMQYITIYYNTAFYFKYILMLLNIYLLTYNNLLYIIINYFNRIKYIIYIFKEIKSLANFSLYYAFLLK